MNFVIIKSYAKKNVIVKISEHVFITFLVSLFLNGCDNKVKSLSANQLLEFENASSASPALDVERLYEAKTDSSPYRVKPQEVLEITMPAILRVVTTDEPVNTKQDDKYICRINESGNITLPVIGEFEAAGKTLAQIETDIIEAYYPKYIQTQPSVFATILEYKMLKVSISGAVQKPGVYSLRSDQMSLISLLMEAGGIIDEGAAVIQIIHSGDSKVKASQNEKKSEPMKNQITEASSSYANSKDIEVQLSFKQSSAQNMTGILTITHDNEVLLNEKMDITNEIERLVLLKQFSLKEPRISIIDVEEKLSALAEIIKPESIKSRETNSAYAIILKEIEDTRKKNLALIETSMGQEPNISNYAMQTVFMPTKLTQNKGRALHNSVGEAVNSSIFSNAALYSNFNITNTGSNSNNEKMLNETSNTDRYQENSLNANTNEIQDSESFILPVKGYNIPFKDVVLQDGDKIIVERLTQPLFSVVGLVNKPGNFVYPPDAKYNLMQAIAFAGGLDPVSDPRYATIYRLKPDSTVCHASFELINTKTKVQLTEALNTPIKPGDIVSVEHTLRTRTNLFLDRVLRFNIGTYFNLNDAWQ